jgi:imidazole glycerol-phosphate synthase subunit HisF
MSTQPRVCVVGTGVANIGSMLAGLARAGAAPVLSTDPDDILAATHVVVPGVGTFGEAIQSLRESNLEGAIVQRFRAGQPLLFVCVGLQILGAESEESIGSIGFNFLPSKVVHFPPGLHVPQQGWNKVLAPAESQYLSNGFAYFSNSYCFPAAPSGDGWVTATSCHGIRFAAAVERGAFLACQFHPELSGEFGQAILRKWISDSPSKISPAVTSMLGPAFFFFFFFWGTNFGFHLVPAPIMSSLLDGGSATHLTRRIIPCLDVKDGKVVKGVQFQALKEAGSPSERSLFYQTQGADEIVMLDVSATVEARKTALQTVREIRQGLMIPLTVGGGVRDVESAQAILEAGADKVSVNTAAVKNPSILGALSSRFGRQCIVLAIDAIQTGTTSWEVVVSSGKEKTGKDVVDWAREGVRLGAGEILLSSWDRDGTKSGYDCELLRRVSSAVPVPVIASGGAATADHLRDALDAGADAVLAASIFHFAEHTVGSLKSDLVSTHQIRLSN